MISIYLFEAGVSLCCESYELALNLNQSFCLRLLSFKVMGLKSLLFRRVA